MNKKPIAFAVILIIIFYTITIIKAFEPKEKGINQISPLVSPSGQYILAVPLVLEEREGFSQWWKPTISDINQQILYVDQKGFPGRFGVYWLWDENDRFWLYNGDDGSIYFWEVKNNEWAKSRYENTKLKPPQGLLPDYAK